MKSQTFQRDVGKDRWDDLVRKSVKVIVENAKVDVNNEPSIKRLIGRLNKSRE